MERNTAREKQTTYAGYVNTDDHIGVVSNSKYRRVRQEK